MKNLDRKGFTLIELLAVITILGILMIVAIPAVQRTIENSRKNTFVSTAKQYANEVKTRWAADEIKCSVDITDGTYYVGIQTHTASGTGSDADAYASYENLISNGGKSSWSGKDLYGYVRVVKAGEKLTTYVRLCDGDHGVLDSTDADKQVVSDKLERKHVVSSSCPASLGIPSGAKTCSVMD